jgi:hypothetical protein
MRHRKQMIPRKPKDILGLALKNLSVGEEVFCTSKTYDAIKDRVHEFTQARQDRSWSILQWGSIKKIKRTA